MADIKIITSVDGYRLKYRGEESEPVPYGLPLEVELSGKRWLAFVDLPQGKDQAEDVESVLESWVYEVRPVAIDENEDIEEDDEDGDEDEDDDSTDEPGPDDEDDEEETDDEAAELNVG